MTDKESFARKNSQPHRVLPQDSSHSPDFLGNRFVHVAISPRAKGLSIGVNIAGQRDSDQSLTNLDIIAFELEKLLGLVRSGGLLQFHPFNSAPGSLLDLKQVTLDDLCDSELRGRLAEILLTVLHVRARGTHFFKIVLVIDPDVLSLPDVRNNLSYLVKDDEIWIELETRTENVFQSTPVSEPDLSHVLSFARHRVVLIRSQFFSFDGIFPTPEQILRYANRLKQLREAKAQIALVQIYSTSRLLPGLKAGLLPLKTLSQIARTIRNHTGIKTEIF